MSVLIDPRLLGMCDGASKSWRIAGGKVKLSVAHDAGAADSASVNVQLKRTALDLAGHPVVPVKPH